MVVVLTSGDLSRATRSFVSLIRPIGRAANERARILETMFDGKPVVAFGVGGIPEVVGECCPLYPFGDVTAAAAGLDTLVESPDLARELGERSRNRALENFSADRIQRLYEALYRRVTAGVA